MRSRQITAKFASDCAECDAPIQVGDKVWWARGTPARHVDCAAANARHDVCPACSGHGAAWNNVPCKSCDGTGSRAVYDFAKSGGHPRKDEPALTI